MKKHVALLMGGRSSERDISLRSGHACAKALTELGHEVSTIDVDRKIATELEALNPDVAFNALHGPFGEDGTIQAILEYLEIPYTHSGVAASAIAMNKILAKHIVANAGVPVASSIATKRSLLPSYHLMNPPYVIKPLCEGSSFGVVLIANDDVLTLKNVCSGDWAYGDDIMLERYIKGRELTCAVMGYQALDVCEIVTKDNYDFYNYDAKYQKGGSNHICPADISPNIYQKVQQLSLLAHQAIGCRGITRSDFRYDEDANELIWLEINTQPGMTETSLVPDVAAIAGYSFNDVVQWILEDASCKR